MDKEIEHQLEEAIRLKSLGKAPEAIKAYEAVFKQAGTHPQLVDLVELYTKAGNHDAASTVMASVAFGVVGRKDESFDEVNRDTLFSNLLESILASGLPDDAYKRHVVGKACFYLNVAIQVASDDPLGLGPRTNEISEKCGWGIERRKSWWLYLDALAGGTDAGPDQAYEQLARRAENGDGTAWYYLGALDNELGEFDRAEERWENIPEDDPFYQTAMTELANRYEDSGGYYHAVQYWERVATGTGPDMDVVRCEAMARVQEFEDQYGSEVIRVAIERVGKAFNGIWRGETEESGPSSDRTEVVGRDVVKPLDEKWAEYFAEHFSAQKQTIQEEHKTTRKEIETRIKENQPQSSIDREAAVAILSKELSVWSCLAPFSRENLINCECRLAYPNCLGSKDFGDCPVAYGKVLVREMRTHIYDPFVQFLQSRQERAEPFTDRFRDSKGRESFSLTTFKLGMRHNLFYSCFSRSSASVSHDLDRLRHLRNLSAHGMRTITIAEAKEFRQKTLGILEQVMDLVRI